MQTMNYSEARQNLAAAHDSAASLLSDGVTNP
jgi:hypothetical protein